MIDERRRFRGVGVALVTPFGADDEIDRESFRALVEDQVRGGVDYLVPCGSTGEAATMSPEEQRAVIEAAVQVAAGRVPVMAGVASSSTREAVRMAQAARDAGADAILAGTPPYNKPPQEGLYAHFSALADDGGLPVFVYNVPGRTAVNVLPETVLRLAEHESVWGVKEASGSLSQMATILRDRPEGFLVLSGDDELALPLIALGGDGVISVVANEVPDRMADLVHRALGGDVAGAREVHMHLLELMRANFVETNPIPVKAALACQGRMSARVRLPLVGISEAGLRRVEAALAAAGALPVAAETA